MARILQYAYARVGFSTGAEHSERTVIGVIVHRQQFKVGEGLSLDRVEALIQCGLSIAEGQQDGDGGGN
jgi:hypothetical protein